MKQRIRRRDSLLRKEGETMLDNGLTFLFVCALVAAAFYYFIDW